MGPGLLHALSQKGICCLGTVRKNRILAKSKLPSRVARNIIKIYTNYPENNLLGGWQIWTKFGKIW